MYRHVKAIMMTNHIIQEEPVIVVHGTRTGSNIIKNRDNRSNTIFK